MKDDSFIVAVNETPHHIYVTAAVVRLKLTVHLWEHTRRNKEGPHTLSLELTPWGSNSTLIDSKSYINKGNQVLSLILF